MTLRTICMTLLGLTAWGQNSGWTRQKAGDVELVSRRAEVPRAELLSALGETRETLDRELVALPATALPVRVLVAESRLEFEKFHRFKNTQGFFQSGTETDYIVLQESGAETLRIARHEMVHRHLKRSTAVLPLWLEEGLAEFYSTLSRKGTEVVAGAPVEAHRPVLAQGHWLTAAQLFALRVENAGDDRSGVFYPQCWALVHMLQLGDGMQGRLSAFLGQLRSGRPEQDAFGSAFGISPDQAWEPLRRYLQRPALPVRRIAGVAAPAPTAPFRLSREELVAVRAEVHMAMGHFADADELLRDISDAGSTQPARTAAQLGLLALRAQNYGLADQELKRALALDSRDPTAWFEYAMLLRDRGGNPAEMERCLRTAVGIAPNYAEAWAQLARIDERRGALDAAAGSYRKAIEINPRHFPYLEALANLLALQGDRVAAIRMAERAEAAAKDRPQREQAIAMRRVWEAGLQPAQPAAPPVPAVRVPDSWQAAPAGAKVAGLLTRIDCPDNGLRFHITRENVTLVLEALDPTKVQMSGGAGGRSFQCGEQKAALHVEAEYTPWPAPKNGTAGTLLRLSAK